MIASGPTVGEPTTAADALAILRRYGIVEPAAALWNLEHPADPVVAPDDPRLRSVENILIATPSMALQAAADAALAMGLTPLILGDSIEGEARDVGFAQADLAVRVQCHGDPMVPPCVLLSGGETTVTLGDAGGRGGRNSEYLLALALRLEGAEDVHAIACDTDGIDGSEDNAGATVHPDTLIRAASVGIDPLHALETHDSYGFFEALGDLVVTGPTFTNVNDFRAMVIGSQRRTGGT